MLISGRFRLGDKLGEGGMGVVHAAVDQVSGSGLALKRLSPLAAQQPLVVELFEREFHTLKNLAHPHIVEVHEYGIDGVPYYTMERLDGDTANARVPLPYREACSVVRDVASALALLHSRRLVHRDVSARNVHCGSDGTVKLIDFGGLTPMGVARDRVGTPAYMAPETVHQLSLDQRTDLYSLGATAYFLLTGRHAYPVRQMTALRDAWRTRPVPPSKLADVPRELDALVLSMLDLNPVARPINAGIVMARLSAIAGLPTAPTEAIARSFLSTPRLVGRTTEVADFQARVVRAMKGRGSCLLVEAQPGMGRSRVLDAFALEAQVVGAVVLRADGRDGGSDVELWAALDRGLQQSRPEQAPESMPPPERALELPTEKLLRRVMRSRGVVILVDDLHQYCPAALTLLSRLLRLTGEQSLLLAASHSLPLPDDVADAVAHLRKKADRIELAALDPAQTRELLASCFDDAPNLQAAADWCHAVSAGRPGTSIALAQHLVDERIAIYAEGSWALPQSLVGHSLPDTAEQLIAERVRRLDDDQRLWGQMLALIPPAVGLTTAECVDMMVVRMTRARSRAALEGLSAEQLVNARGTATRVDQSNVAEAFLATLPIALAESLHRMLATHLEARDDVASLSAAAFHLQQTGDPAEAIRLVNLYARRATEEVSEEELARRVVPFGQWGETFESALMYAEARNWPRRELYPIYTAIMTMAALSEPRWLDRGSPLLGYLKRDTGLDYYDEAELDGFAAGAPVRRLKLVWRLLKATLRHLFTPKRDRGLLPPAALELLGVYTTSALGAANMTQTFHSDGPALARALSPFRSLSPALDLLYELMIGSVDAGRGLAAGWTRLQGVIERLHTKVSGMPDIYRTTAHNIVRYLDALECRAPLGDLECLEIAQWLQDAGGFDTHAWQLRMLYYLYVGDGANAERCRQELETHALTSARDNLSVVAGSKDVAQAQALGGDAHGLRRTLESLEATARRFPRWRGQLLVYRGEYSRLVGDLPLALAALEEAMAFAPAGENYSWAKAVPPYVDVLVRLGRVDQAVVQADAAVAEAARLRLAPIYRRHIEAAAAMAWAAHGQHDRAAATLDRLLQEAAEQGVRGITVATLEEARARLALLCGDAAGFERACHGVARVFANHDNPVLVGRYRRLVEEADHLDLQDRVSIRPPSKHATLARTLSEVRERIDHTTSEVRLRRALELLVKHCDAEGGHLFLTRDDAVECVASVGEVVSTIDLEGFVQSLRRMDTDFSAGVTAADLGLDDDITEWCRWTSDGGATYDPVLLPELAEQDSGNGLAVALLRPRGDTLRQPAPEFLHALSQALTETGDITSAPRKAATGGEPR